MKKIQLILTLFLATGLFLTFNLVAFASVGAPSLVSPDNNDLINVTKPTFQWSGGENADNYRLVIDDDQNFATGDNVYDDNNIGGSKDTITIENELDDGDYWWKIAAENSDSGAENWSENVWTFEIDTTAPSVSGINVSERDNDSAEITWSWSTSETPSGEIHYGDTADMNSSETFGSGDTSDTLTGLSEYTTYYFEIEVEDEAGNSSTSETENFVTLALPSSSIYPLDHYWITKDNIEITASASDEDGVVENVFLYYRYRENCSTGWDNWENYGAGAENSDNWSWNFAFPENDGFYELHTRAIDNANQLEHRPENYENLGFDTVPPSLSSIQINNDNVATACPIVTVSIEAEDETSGLSQMRFKTNEQNWGSWKPFDNKDNYTFTPPYGTRTINVQVKDNAAFTSNIATDNILLENAVFTKNIEPINENENKTADFSNWGLIVENVTLFAKENITENIEIGLRVENKKPLENIKKPAPIVMKYFQIETNCSNEEIKQIEIGFFIKQSWLNKKEIKPEDIKVWKYENKWKPVKTSITRENSTYVYYKATTSNLSWFAITKKTETGLPWTIIIIIIAIAGGILFYLFAWPELEPRIKSARKSGGKGLPSRILAHKIIRKLAPNSYFS